MKELADLETVLRPDLLLAAYRLGVFPMALEDGELGWFSPDPRGVLPLADFHVPHGLKRVLRRNPFELRINTAFREVVAGCAARPQTWIDARIQAAYWRLHQLGWAHSVECWRQGRLVGGLYGVAVGGAFFGESMFHQEPDASKVALHGLVMRLVQRGFTLLDIQWVTPHLQRFGALEIPRREYLRQLVEAVVLRRTFV